MNRMILVSLILTLFFSVGILHADQLNCGGHNSIVSPAVLDFGTILKGGSKTLVATITSTLGAGGTFFFESSSRKLILSDDKKLLVFGKSFGLQVTLPSNLPIGNFSDQVVILENIQVSGDGSILPVKEEQCRIPVTANVVSPLLLDKGSLDFGTVTQGQSVPSQFFKLSALQALAFKITVDPGGTPVTIVPSFGNVSGGGNKIITVTLNTQNVPSLTSRVRLIVEASPGVTNVVDPLNKFIDTVQLSFSIVAAPPPPPPPPPPAGKPDLAFNGALSIPTPTAGQGNSKTVTVSMTIKNIGTVALTQQSSGEVLLDDVVKTSFVIPPLTAGATVNLQATFQTNKSGTHQVTVKLDSPVSQINENNENNNLATSGVNL